MEQAKDRAIYRVLRKLSAMRATFGEQEQQILDTLIVRDEAEVEAHMRKEFLDSDARKPEPDEARAHVRSLQDAEARKPEPDEARAHARTSEVSEARVNSAKVPGPALRVIFDPASGEYRLI
jgi:ferric-dicitrate binding protein FerR (iron transport regulator)